MKFHYRKHKIRFDRGRMWYSSVQSIITAILVTLFISETSLIGKILYTVGVFVLIYLLGWIDDKLKLLDREQHEYYKRNPYMEKLTKDIEEIKQKFNENKSKLSTKK